MKFTNRWSFATLVLFAVFILESCKQGSHDGTSGENTLFRQIASKASGIDFSNTLHESDSFNAIFYEFFYNGSGVAIGDVNNDGFSDIFLEFYQFL